MKSNHTYPEYYFSKKIKDLFSLSPQLPTEPIAPIEPKQPINPGEADNSNYGCFIFMFIGSIVGFIAILSSGRDDIAGFILPGIAVIALSFFLVKTGQWDKEGHEKKQEEYKRAIREYPSLMKKYQEIHQEYLDKKRKYDNTVALLTSKSIVASTRKRAIAEWLSNRSIPDFSTCDSKDTIKKGLSESMFVEELRCWGFSVYTNRKIAVGSKYYYPDILIEEDGLYIDIEIDEPYVGNDGTPIHYLETKYGILESIDEERNEFIAKSGFEIIRFSEEQIFLHTDACLAFIQTFIESIKEACPNIEIEADFAVKKWTKEQAFKLAYQRFRNTYVPYDMQQFITKESYKSYEDLRREIEEIEEIEGDDLPF